MAESQKDQGSGPPIGFEHQGNNPQGGNPQAQWQAGGAPPSYQDVTGVALTKIDFPPAKLSHGSFTTMPQFERFEMLMQRANQWLQSNPQMIVIHVEGVESIIKHNSQFADTESSINLEYAERNLLYNRSLRLWARTRQPSDPQHVQQIAYYNVIPACISKGGLLANPEFEPFNATIARVNQLFRNQPVQGKIITLETEEVRLSTNNMTVDADETFWVEYGERPTFFVMVIRIFYEVGQPAMEEIGCADFVPGKVGEGSGIFSIPVYEPMSVVAGRAHQWIRQQVGLRITNIQTIDYKVQGNWGGSSVDTMRSCFYQHGDRPTFFLRIMRVCHVRSMRGDPVPPPPYMSYRTFSPHCVQEGGAFSLPQYTNQSSTVEIAIAWLRATGAKVISAETVPVRWRSGGQRPDPEVTMTLNSGHQHEMILYMIRVFLDGIYQEPPPSVLPQPTPMQVAQANTSNECCTLL